MSLRDQACDAELTARCGRDTNGRDEALLAAALELVRDHVVDLPVLFAAIRNAFAAVAQREADRRGERRSPAEEAHMATDELVFCRRIHYDGAHRLVQLGGIEVQCAPPGNHRIGGRAEDVRITSAAGPTQSIIRRRA